MNRGDVANYVLDRLQISSADTAKVGQIDQLINQTIYRINADYSLTVATANVTITGGTGAATLPSDLQKIIALTQTTVAIDVVDEINFSERLTAIAAGTAPVITNPPTIAVFRPPATLATLPVPTANVTAALVYVQRPTPPALDATAIPLPLEYHDLIAEIVCWRMALTEGEIFIARFTAELVQDLRGEIAGLSTRMPGQSGWAIPLKGY